MVKARCCLVLLLFGLVPSAASGAAEGDSSSSKAFRVSSLIVPIYIPQAVMWIATSATYPTLPIFARELNATDVQVGAAVGARDLGNILVLIPAGGLVGKYGPKKAMECGMLVIALFALLSAACSSVTSLGLCRLMVGVGGGVQSVGVQTYISGAAPVELRGRSLSTLGGVVRIALILGTLLGGFMGQGWGLTSVFIFECAGTLFALVASAVGMPALPVDAVVAKRIKSGVAACCGDVAFVFKHFMPEVRTIGVYCVSLAVVRNGRNIVLPLAGDNVGLTESTIGIILSVSFLVDALFFPAAGKLMDARGRKAAGVPSAAIQGAAYLLVPFAFVSGVTSSGGLAILTLAGAIAGGGNGLSSGLIMCLSADIAPFDKRGQFLGVFRFITDTGLLLAPILVGAATEAVGLGGAAIMVGLVGLSGAVFMHYCVRETMVANPTLAHVEPTGTRGQSVPKSSAGGGGGGHRPFSILGEEMQLGSGGGDADDDDDDAGGDTGLDLDNLDMDDMDDDADEGHRGRSMPRRASRVGEVTQV